MKSILTALLLTTATPALASVPEEIEVPTETAPEETPAADPTKSLLDGVMAIFAGMFDTSKLEPVDPARLKLAEVTAAKLLPTGAYAKIMEDMIGNILTPLFADMPGITDFKISSVTGVSYDDVEKLTPEQKDAIGELIDPFGKQRGEQTIAIVKPMLSDAMIQLEPPIRQGMSRAYARRFSVAELNAINRFFATPTGAAFAQESFRLQADPEVLQASFKALPTLLTGFKGKEAEVTAKFEALPKEKKLADLSPAEMQKLAALLGTSVQSLEDHRALMTAAAEAEVEMLAEDPGVEETGIVSGETGDEPWYLDTNWASSDTKKAEALGKSYDSLSAKTDAAFEKSNAAFKAWEEARAKAIEAARAKYKADGWQAPAPVEVADPPADT